MRENEVIYTSGETRPAPAADQKRREALWRLLAVRAERYTMGESTSMPEEQARELLESIVFSLGLLGEGLSAMDPEDPEAALRLSWEVLERRMAEGRELLRRVRVTEPPVGNISYRETLNGLGAFFKKYDYRFFAHQVPGDIDYQLCRPVPEGEKGVLYVNSYLRRLLTENELCSRFPGERLAALLHSYCPNPRAQLINIYDAAAVNALGRALLGCDVLPLGISEGERQRLRALFDALTPQGAREALSAAAAEVCRQLGIRGRYGKEYLRSAALELWPRIEAESAGLSGIFLPLHG